MDKKDDVQKLVNLLTSNLTIGNEILPAKGYVAFLNMITGPAVIVWGDDKEKAKLALLDMRKQMQKLGVDNKVHVLGLVTEPTNQPWCINISDGKIQEKIDNWKKHKEAHSTPLKFSMILKIIGHYKDLIKNTKKNEIIKSFVSVEKGDIKSKDISDINHLNDELRSLIINTFKKIVGTKKISLADVEIDIEELTYDNSMLPIILVCAAMDWTPVVLKLKNQGGFMITLKEDIHGTDSLLGYSLQSLYISSPLMFLLPLISTLKSAVLEDEVKLDFLVARFSQYLNYNGMNNRLLNEAGI